MVHLALCGCNVHASVSKGMFFTNQNKSNSMYSQKLLNIISSIFFDKPYAIPNDYSFKPSIYLIEDYFIVFS